jgi:hypothetical protein
MEQRVLVGIAIVRVSPEENAGGPNGNGRVLSRVSITLHGVMATNTAGVGSVVAAVFTATSSRMRPRCTGSGE